MIIVNEIKRLLDSINGIPIDDFNEINEFLEHDEWGLALEILCVVIKKENITISLEQFKEIEIIGKEMKMDDELWIGIKH